MIPSEKIIWNLLDCFRGTLETFDSFELALQILAWAKLSATKQLPDNLCLDENSKSISTKELFEIFERLTTLDSLGENRFAFKHFLPKRTDLNDISVVGALNVVQDVMQSGVLDHFEIPESLYDLIPKRIEPIFVPSEVADFMSHLAGDMEGKQIYCPYDTLCQFASRAYRLGADVSVETPLSSQIPWLTNILIGANIHTLIGDPIRQPGFVLAGKLKSFDLSIAFPPWGMKYDAEVIEKDWFNRFSERTFSGSVLATRHILAHTQKKAVIAVPNNILFSRGAEHSLREDLLNKKMVEAVINMPPALLSATAVQFSILLLDIQGTASTVRFVNGSAEKFFTRDGKGRSRLIHWEELLDTFHKAADDALVVTVPVKDVLKNDAQLEVSRYLLPPEQKRTAQLLERANTCQLKEIVEFIRPITKTRDEGKIDVLEVSISDFPEYGYLLTPERQTTISNSTLNDKNDKHFLRAGDIVIVIKGSAGKVAIVSDDVPPAGKGGWVVNQSCLILRTHGRIDPKVLFIYLRSDVGQTLLKRIVSGATIPLIQLRALQELKVIVPPIEEAQSIRETFDTQVQLQKQIEQLRQQQQKLSKVHWEIKGFPS